MDEASEFNIQERTGRRHWTVFHFTCSQGFYIFNTLEGTVWDGRVACRWSCSVDHNNSTPADMGEGCFSKTGMVASWLFGNRVMIPSWGLICFLRKQCHTEQDPERNLRRQRDAIQIQETPHFLGLFSLSVVSLEQRLVFKHLIWWTWKRMFDQGDWIVLNCQFKHCDNLVKPRELETGLRLLGTTLYPGKIIDTVRK